MKNNKNTLRTLGCLLLLSCTLQVQAATILRFGFAGSDSDTQSLAAKEFAQRVKDGSKGELVVRPYGNSMLGNDQAMIAGVRGGTIEMEMSGTPNFSGLTPRMSVLDLPFVFADSAHAYRVLDGEIGQKLLDDLETHNLKGLAYWEVGFRDITNSRKPVRVPEDVKGLKIRTSSNPAQIEAFRLLGANPQPLPLAELYNALEMKAVDAQEHPLSITWSSGFYEVQKYLSQTHHAYTALVLVMNKEKFDALPAEQQKLLVDAARAAGQSQRKMNAENDSKFLVELAEKGMQIEPNVDREAFRKAVSAPVREAFVKQHGSELLDAIDALR
ncbi:TRAP transporter substrate-binding protein [Pseudomonas fulva]|uniref:TRAP dicarboxylate transporter, DctP subunit n=1 Tax=Pseudomonas fulva (strain 12-X) TaxID=743720 RepID=F6AD89_PSEF1|nr:TRAP transporter substrate-binding protein [Pseudomonas fulva]AEF23466.1 TRAP dicarboxylate transporter, DctP subunit [Pseudomonas fulva 12-X]